MPTASRRLSDQRDRFITAVTREYTSQLGGMIDRAQAAALARLSQELRIDPQGRVALTPENSAVLARIDQVLLEEAEQQGLPALVRGFVQTFPATLPLFRSTVESITSRLRTPLPPLVLATADDAQVLAAQQTSAEMLLRDAVARAAQTARNNALLQVGAVSYPELVGAMAQAFRRSVGESDTLAATTLATYYRTIAARSYDRLQAAVPGAELLYQYIGPLDRLTRPKCREWLRGNRQFTRAEIDRLSNGTRLPVWLSGGGYRCRHSWQLAGIRRRAQAA